MQTIPAVLLAQFRNKSLPRGIRNNNPGNIDYSPRNDWRGQVSPGSLPADAKDPRFAQFQTPEHGIRALISLLRTYYNKHGLHTTKQIINRWAPSVENDTQAYIRSVLAQTGLPSQNSIVNLSDAKVAIGFARAIVMHECGYNPYDQATYDRAFALLN